MSAPAGDKDWFAFQVSSSAEVWLYTIGDVDTLGILYKLDSSERSLELLEYDDDGGRGRNFFIEQSLVPGTYFVQVTGYEDETGYYTIYNRPTSDGGTSIGTARGYNRMR